MCGERRVRAFCESEQFDRAEVLAEITRVHLSNKAPVMCGQAAVVAPGGCSPSKMSLLLGKISTPITRSLFNLKNVRGVVTD